MAYSNLPVLERFYNKVQLPDSPDGCWIWAAGTTSAGYGRFSFNKREGLAHRFSYQYFIGAIPEGMYICHRCDNPSCVNPAHLFAATQKDNLADMVRKGRACFGDRNGSRIHPERVRRGDNHPFKLHPEKIQRGEAHSQAKLTENQVREIRQRFVAGGVNYPQLAHEYGVNKATISDIVNRRYWKHID